MFFTVSVLLVAGVGLIWKFRERLAFRYGRLSRSHHGSPSTPLTSMGADQFIELSFGRVHYVYRPSSSSTTLNIFVHGFSIPMQIWEDIFQFVANENEACLIFDLYGRGWSDAPSVPMNVDLFVSQLAELLYALNLPYEKYHLFGVSMGGMIVRRFTQLYPSKVSKLILCCPVGFHGVVPGKLIMSILALPILGPFLFKAFMARSNSKSVRAQWAYPDRQEYQRYMRLFREIVREHPGYLRSLLSTVLCFDFQSAWKTVDSIDKLNIPILIVWGDQDSLIPVEDAYRYHKSYKKSSLTIIPGANHSLLIEHSKDVIDALKPFLNNK